MNECCNECNSFVKLACRQTYNIDRPPCARNKKIRIIRFATKGECPFWDSESGECNHPEGPVIVVTKLNQNHLVIVHVKT